MLKSQHELRLKHYSYQCMSYLVPLWKDCDSELCLCAGGLCLFEGVPSSSLNFCLFVWGFFAAHSVKKTFFQQTILFSYLYMVFSLLSTFYVYFLMNRNILSLKRERQSEALIFALVLIQYQHWYWCMSTDNIMLWRCFSAARPCSGLRESSWAQHIEISSVKTCPSAKDLRLGWRFTFQDDSDPKHTAKATQEWLRDNSDFMNLVTVIESYQIL